MDRRRYLATLTGVATGTIAGCSGDDEGETGTENEGGDEDSPTPTKTVAPESSADNGSPNGDETSGEADITVVDISPDSGRFGESFEIEITFRNDGDGNGIKTVSTYIAATNGRDPAQDDWELQSYTLRLDPGETTTKTSGTATPDRPSVYYIGVGSRTADHEIHVPPSKAPILTDAALVSDWQNAGDLEANRISSAPAGDPITIAYRYWYWSEQRRLDVFRDVKVFDSSGDRVGINTTESEQLMDSVGWRQFEVGSRFDTRDWGPGQYRAEVIVENRESGEVSDSYETTFELE